MRVLTAEEIMQVQAESRTRGDYLVQLQKLVESGDLGWDFTDLFPGKTPEAIRSSVNNNIDKHGHELNWPKLKAMITKDEKCVVFNMDAYEAAVHAAEEQTVAAK